MSVFRSLLAFYALIFGQVAVHGLLEGGGCQFVLCSSNVAQLLKPVITAPILQKLKGPLWCNWNPSSWNVSPSISLGSGGKAQNSECRMMVSGYFAKRAPSACFLQSLRQSCVRAVEGSVAGSPTVPKVAFLTSPVLLLAFDFPEMAHRHSDEHCYCLPWILLKDHPSSTVKLSALGPPSSHMGNIGLYLVSPPDLPASVFCYCIFINN